MDIHAVTGLELAFRAFIVKLQIFEKRKEK